jgi:hypothetical protein
MRKPYLCVRFQVPISRREWDLLAAPARTPPVLCMRRGLRQIGSRSEIISHVGPIRRSKALDATR